MEPLIIKETAKTPSVEFDSDQGVLELKGRSHPEDTREFYRPVIAWAEQYAESSPEETTVNIQLEHFNTSSSKSILEIFKSLEKIKTSGKNIIINWYYEEDDEDLMEAGENYEAITGMPFNFVGY